MEGGREGGREGDNTARTEFLQTGGQKPSLYTSKSVHVVRLSRSARGGTKKRNSTFEFFRYIPVLRAGLPHPQVRVKKEKRAERKA